MPHVGKTGRLASRVAKEKGPAANREPFTSPHEAEKSLS